MFLFFLQGRAPFAAKAHFVQPVSRGESGNESCKRNQGHCPRFFSEKRPDDGETRAGQFKVAAMNAMNTAAASAQTGKKLIHGARSLHFRIIEAYTGDGVRVASCKANFPEPRREPLRAGVGLGGHLTVARFESGDIGSQPAKVFFFAPTGQPREDVVDAEE